MGSAVQGFLDDFKEKYVQLEQCLTVKDKGQAAQKIMSALTFLYLIQKKDLLRKLFQKSIKKTNTNFFLDYLQPLFYQEINIKSGINYWKPYELDIPDHIFSNIHIKGKRDADGILDIFECYNFTMHEGQLSDKEALTPEILGAVFESLLDMGDRKSKGTFYTPREIVHYMCQESLVNYLVRETHISYGALKDFITCEKCEISKEIMNPENNVNRLDEIDQALADIRVADPAVGCGAFPLAMLTEIVNVRGSITQYYARFAKGKKNTKWMGEGERHPLILKLHTIKNSLFAADIEPEAVNITKLRLWLSLLAEQGTEGTLPCLAYNIYCENSLINGGELSKVFEEKGGFNIVIGNPPYIDSENMVNSGMEEMRNYISSKYTFTKGNWDIYIAFFEKGYNLLAPKGILAYITPDKWLSKPFGAMLRKATISNIFAILKIGRNVFDAALIDSIVTFISKLPSNAISVYKMENKKIVKDKEVSKKILSAPYALDIIFSDAIHMISKIEQDSFPLNRQHVCENACATSDAYKLKEIIYSLPSAGDYNDSYLKIINTGTIGRYLPKWGYQSMTYLKDKYRYPVVTKEKFFEAFKNSYAQKSVKPKIIIKGLTLLDACLDEAGSIIPGKSTMIIPCSDIFELKYLLSIINSKLMIFYVKQKYSSSSYIGGINFTKDMINNLPMRPINNETKSLLVATVDNIIAGKRLDVNADTSVLEKEIDRIIYKLYGLSDEEIRIVEGEA